MSDLIAKPSRRGFLRGLGLIIAAPAIVKAENIMKVRPFVESLAGDFDTATMRYVARERYAYGYTSISAVIEFGKIVEPALNRVFNEVYEVGPVPKTALVSAESVRQYEILKGAIERTNAVRLSDLLKRS